MMVIAIAWSILEDMAFEVVWEQEADEDMAKIEASPALAPVLEAANRALGRLELNPGDSRLHTRQFQTDDLGYLRMTPLGVGEWHIFWQALDDPDEVLVRRIVETPAP